MNEVQQKIFAAAREAVFARASQLHAEGYDTRRNIVASMTDLLDQLDAFEKSFEDRSGVELAD